MPGWALRKNHVLRPAALLAEGLRMLQARETLHAEVRKGFEQMDNGEGIPAEAVYRRAEERIREIENGKK